MFVDGDHSWDGIETDWDIVRQKLRRGGVVCLHDAIVPIGNPRRLNSARFYEEVIEKDRDFVAIGWVDSMVALRRV